MLTMSTQPVGEGQGASLLKLVEALMSGHTAEERHERSSPSSLRSLGLSAIDRACVRYLVGHTLARIEREFILQTLRFHHGNRTHAAGLLGISLRSLRD